MTMLVPPVSRLSDSRETGAPEAAPLISVVVPVYKEERNIRPFLERRKIQPVYVKSIGVRSGAKYPNYRIAGKSWLRPQALSYCIARSVGVWHERIYFGDSETFRTTR